MPQRDTVNPAGRPPAGTIAKGALIPILAVYVALRVLTLWTPRLWGDELFNYSLSLGTWITLLKRAGLDMAHPPLFYFVLKPWIYLAGSSLPMLRLLTVAISIAAIVPFLSLCRDLGFRTRETALALSLMAVNGYLVLYSYYLRPYSLLFCLSLYSYVAFVRFLERGGSDQRRSLRVLVLVNVLFTYTHYAAWLVLAAQYLWIVLTDRRRLPQLTVAMAVVALCSLPWVGVIVYVSTQVPYTFWDQMTWPTPPNARSLILLLRSFNGGFASARLTLAGSAACLLLVILAIAHSRSRSREATPASGVGVETLPLLAWLTMFPIGVSLMVSYAFTWIWEPRYLIDSTGPYLLLLGASAFRLRARPAQVASVAFLLVWSTTAGLTDNLAEALHGPNAPSYWLARDVSRVETRREGPIPVYSLSPYAGQGLGLAFSITGERRFKIIACRVDAPLPDEYFWIAVTEHDPLAAARRRALAADPRYSLGEPVYSGTAPQRHIVIPVWRR